MSRKRKGLKRAALGALVLLLVLAVFHRPLIFRLTRYLLVRAAQKQSLALDYQISGSIFTNLRVTALEAMPTEPGPVEHLSIGSMALEYSLVDLLRKGLPGFLKTASLADVSVIINPNQELPFEKRRQPQRWKFPALIPESLYVRNLNFIARGPAEDLVVQGLDLRLEPSSEGWVRARTVQIPGVGRWTDLTASAGYLDRKLVLSRLDLGKEVQIDRLSLDMSAVGKSVLRFDLDAGLFGGIARTSGEITELNSRNVLKLASETRNTSLTGASAFLKLKQQIKGDLREVDLSFDGEMNRPQTWTGRAVLRIENWVLTEQLRLGEAKMQVEMANGKATVSVFEASRGPNTLSANAVIDLPQSTSGFSQLNGAGMLKLRAPELAGLVPTLAEGALEADGPFWIKEGTAGADLRVTAKRLALKEGQAENAEFQLLAEKRPGKPGDPFWQGLKTEFSGTSGKFRFKDYVGESARFRILTENQRVTIKELKISSGPNTLEGSGRLQWPLKHAEFELRIDAPDLKQSLSGRSAQLLEGSAALKGKLAGKAGRINGELTLSGAGLRYAGSPAADLTANLSVVNDVVRVDKLSLRQNGAEVLTGKIEVPIELGSQAPFGIAQDRPLAVDLRASAIELGRLSPTGRLRGVLTGSLMLNGSVGDPRATLEIRGRDLLTAAMGNLAAASLDLTLTLARGRLAVAGAIRQPDIPPVEISGELPVDLPQLLRGERSTAPLRLAMRMPPTPLGFLKKISPAVRLVEGLASLNVSVGGTFQKPDLSGSLSVRLPRLRLQRAADPDVSAGIFEPSFRGTTITVERATAKLAGGPLSIRGTIEMADLLAPVLNLNLIGDSILIARNDSFLFRANLGLSFQGPLASAQVAGTAALTESEFFRDVEILPLNLPGRPPPVLPLAPKPVSFPMVPFRDWTLDVAVSTADPFLVRGNLAAGTITGSGRLGGTGLTPTLDGTAEVTNLLASLPFSRLRIVSGFIYFLPGGELLNPQVNLHGISEIRSHHVDVYISGPIRRPDTLFLSQPPLAREDIITLLATGTTREELTGNANVLAGRATWLLFQKLYRQVFGTNFASFSDLDFLSRAGIELGGIDPRTGEQSLIARFELAKNWVLTGVANIGGGVQGRVSYLVRLR